MCALGAENDMVYLEHRVDHEIKLWKALNGKLKPAQVGWGEIPTFGDSQGVFKVETAMFWLELGSHLGDGG